MRPRVVALPPLLPFIAVTVPLVLIPGASTAVVLRNSIAGGVRGGVMTAVGINAGSFCYGLLSALGFAAALRRWPSGWTVVHGAGVLYLGWLGLRSLRRAARPPACAFVPDAAPPHAPWRSVAEGFLTNVLNPAIATFYLVVVPQFIPEGAPIARSVLVLTAVHIALAATWHVAWAAAGARSDRGRRAGRAGCQNRVGVRPGGPGTRFALESIQERNSEC